MTKHKTEDYKNSAVKYYLNNENGYKITCKIFDCKKSTTTNVGIYCYRKYKNEICQKFEVCKYQ